MDRSYNTGVDDDSNSHQYLSLEKYSKLQDTSRLGIIDLLPSSKVGGRKNGLRFGEYFDCGMVSRVVPVFLTNFL
jgi:hypothetical protein